MHHLSTLAHLTMNFESLLSIGAVMIATAMASDDRGDLLPGDAVTPDSYWVASL